MKHWLKIVGGSLGALVVVLLLGALALVLLVDPNRYKDDVEQLVLEKTGRQLTLQGDLKLSVFPWVAVQVGPAQLSERLNNGRPVGEFGDQPFIALQAARLSVKLWPLLRGQFEVGNVTLDRPVIRLITLADGRHNWDDLAASKSETSETPSNSGPVDASIAGVEISQGEIILEDRRESSRMALHDFVLQATDIRRGQPFHLQTGFSLERKGDAAHLVLSADIKADWQSSRYAISKLVSDLTLLGPAYPKTGLPMSVRLDAASVDLAQQTASLDGLLLSVAGADLTGALTAQEILDAPRATGHITVAPFGLRELLQKLNVQPPSTRDPQALKRVGLESDIVVTSSSAMFNNLELRVDDIDARGELGLADIKSRALRFKLDVTRVDFDRYLPPAETSADTSGSPTAPTAIPSEMLRTLNVRGELNVGEAKFSGISMTRLRVALNARGGDVQVTPVQASLYGGTLRSDIALNVAGAEPRLALKAQSEGIDFAPLMRDMLQVKNISGHGTLHADLTAAGKDTQLMLQSLAGKLDFNLQDGAYEGTDLWYEIRRARALFKQQPIPERTGPERTAFTAIQGTGALAQGVMTNPDLSLATQYLKIDGNGTVDLVQGKLNYKLNAKILRIPPEGKPGGDMTELVDAEIPMTVTGPFAEPKVRPDVEGYLKARAQKELQKETDKLKNKLQNKLRDLLGG